MTSIHTFSGCRGGLDKDGKNNVWKFQGNGEWTCEVYITDRREIPLTYNQLSERQKIPFRDIFWW